MISSLCAPQNSDFNSDLAGYESYRKSVCILEEEVNQKFVDRKELDCEHISLSRDASLPQKTIEHISINKDVFSFVSTFVSERRALNSCFRQKRNKPYFTMRCEFTYIKGFLADFRAIKNCVLNLVSGTKHVTITCKNLFCRYVSFYDILLFHPKVTKDPDADIFCVGSQRYPKKAASLFLEYVWGAAYYDRQYGYTQYHGSYMKDFIDQWDYAILSIPGQEKERIIIHDLFRQMIEALNGIEEPEDEMRVAEIADQPESDCGDLEQEWEFVEDEFNQH